MQTFHTFKTAQEATDYRRENGAGGWIFVASEMAILFPPSLTPQDIFLHPFTKGMSGELIGHGLGASTRDISTISEYGLEQKLSNSVRCF